MAHPSKAAFSSLKCHTRAYLNRRCCGKVTLCSLSQAHLLHLHLHLHLRMLLTPPICAAACCWATAARAGTASSAVSSGALPPRQICNVWAGTYSIAGPRSVMFNVQVMLLPQLKTATLYRSLTRVQGEALGIFMLTVFFVALTMMGFR